MNRGYVYVLTNVAMPWLVKIGSTTADPFQRAAALSGTTGVPLPFTVELYGEFMDCRAVEKQIHSMMDGFRVSANREFFGLDYGWRVLEEACSWVYHHPDRIGPFRHSSKLLELCEIESIEDIFNRWTATI